jgi:hypothetical protein
LQFRTTNTKLPIELEDGIISHGKIENVNSVKKIKMGTNFIIKCDAVISMTKENHALKNGT